MFTYADGRGRRRPDRFKPGIGVKHYDPRKSAIEFLSTAERGSGS